MGDIERILAFAVVWGVGMYFVAYIIGNAFSAAFH